MKITVKIQEWAYACCGTPLRLGDAAAWELYTTAEEEPGVYLQDSHDDAADWGETVVPVPGTVTKIIERSHRYLPAVGDPITQIRDEAHFTDSDVAEVTNIEEREFSELIVELEVSDDVPLPVAKDRSRAAVVHDPEEDVRERAIASSSGFFRLGHLIRDIQVRFGSKISVETDELHQASCVPINSGAAGIWWSWDYSEPRPGLLVTVADEQWNLEGTEQGVAQLESMVEAVAAGSVAITVRRNWRGDRWLVTELQDDKGHLFRQKSERLRVPRKGAFSVLGNLMSRLEAGDRTFDGWNI